MLLNDLIELRKELRVEAKRIVSHLNSTEGSSQYKRRRYSYLAGLIRCGKEITKIIKKEEYKANG